MINWSPYLYYLGKGNTCICLVFKIDYTTETCVTSVDWPVELSIEMELSQITYHRSLRSATHGYNWTRDPVGEFLGHRLIVGRTDI